ncbi:MAG: ester cyclase [bacterium]
MKKLVFLLLSSFVLSSFAYADDSQCSSPEVKAKIKELEAKLKVYTDDAAEVKKNIETFDTLDYVVFSNQEWTRLHESHAKNVIVNWPDGHKTKGIKKHIEDLKTMFVYAPDTKIQIHPIKFGKEGFTCVTGIMTGTFTKPMPIGNGKFIQPTGKKFSLPMCTVGHWKNGVMVEEWLYWDGATYAKQMGL